MTWRETLGLTADASVDLATVQRRYHALRERADRKVCESRRLKQAMETARAELTARTVRRRKFQ
jgi:hypothetical protein